MKLISYESNVVGAINTVGAAAENNVGGTVGNQITAGTQIATDVSQLAADGQVATAVNQGIVGAGQIVADSGANNVGTAI